MTKRKTKDGISSCPACRAYGQEDHTCKAFRPLTAAEAEFIEAWFADNSNPHRWSERWIKAEDALKDERAERAGRAG